MARVRTTGRELLDLLGQIWVVNRMSEDEAIALAVEAQHATRVRSPASGSET
jgi:hypothetical protein